MWPQYQPLPSRAARAFSPGLQQPAHVVDLVADALAIVGPVGGQHVVADAVAVDAQLVEPQRGGVEPRLGDRLVGQLAPLCGGSAIARAPMVAIIAPRPLADRRDLGGGLPAAIVEFHFGPTVGRPVGGLPLPVAEEDFRLLAGIAEHQLDAEPAHIRRERRHDRHHVVAGREQRLHVVSPRRSPAQLVVDVGHFLAVETEGEVMIGRDGQPGIFRFRPGRDATCRRKKRSPRGALTLRSAPGSGKPDPLGADERLGGNRRIDLQVGARSSGPSSRRPAAGPFPSGPAWLQSLGLPSRSHARTFQKHACRDPSGLPA